MEKGYYGTNNILFPMLDGVSIHNKNGKGLLRGVWWWCGGYIKVSIHNKNGKGLLPHPELGRENPQRPWYWSQSTIKMEKGYYIIKNERVTRALEAVSIHNKNGKGLLHKNK